MSATDVLGIARNTISIAKNGSAEDLPQPQAMAQKLREAVGKELSAGETMAVRHFFREVDRVVDKTDASPKAEKLHAYQDTLRDILSNTEFSLSGSAAEYIRMKVLRQPPRWF